MHNLETFSVYYECSVHMQHCEEILIILQNLTIQINEYKNCEKDLILANYSDGELYWRLI